ncbi:MAG TPA: four-carbon acid sugar kinase family protein [Verrucomicrobiae bacterium]|nr:four-carbon acid sugar kinase family protein [Verrucomicrobiae bacterium]
MIGVIADDLTGAAEIGAVGVRHGLRAEVVVNGNPNRNADLVCIDTDSRGSSPAEAARRAAAAARLLRKSGARWIYKKVDSVLRGPVVAELEGVMKTVRLRRALLVPANPSLGRVIREGRYFVSGTPIHKTEFARDPEHPRHFSDVLALLGSSKFFPIRVCRAGDFSPDPGIIVGEAGSTSDLRRWADKRTAEILTAGGAEFFAALLAAALGDGMRSRQKRRSVALANRRPSPRVLFICGTASGSSRKFVTSARARRVPVVSLPRELARGDRFTAASVDAIARQVIAAVCSHSRVIVNIGLPMVRDRRIARRLAIHLVRVAGSVLRRGAIHHVYVEGGATAAELVRRMGWERLTVVREVAPGVATLAVEGNPDFLLTIKPGSYVWPAL